MIVGIIEAEVFMNRIYLDYASTTPVSKSVVDAMKKIYEDYTIENVEIKAKETFMKLLNFHEGEIIFTGTGTEANNIAIDFHLDQKKNFGRHIIVSSIEHPSVKNKVIDLEKKGYVVSHLNVNAVGVVDTNHLLSLIQPDTVLVLVMLVNNEVGAIQPIEKISKIIAHKNIALHVDAIQALGKMDLNFGALGADSYSFSAHKIYGPKGIGALYIKSHLINRYEGFNNEPYIRGFEVALRDVLNQKEAYMKKLKQLQHFFLDGLKKISPEIKMVGSLESNCPSILTVYFPKIDADSLLIHYDMHGVAVSAGSACSSGALSPSHVLLAMGFNTQEAKRCVRFSFGRDTSEESLEKVLRMTEQIWKG